MKILLISPRFPFPPLKGDQLRAWSFAKHLSRDHGCEITYLSTSDEKPPKESYEREFEKYQIKKITTPFNKQKAKLRMILSIASLQPSQVGYYQDNCFLQRVEEILTRESFDLIFLQLSRIHPVVEIARKLCPQTPRVMDFMDSFSLNMKNRAEKEHFPKNIVFGWESRKVKRVEVETLSQVDLAYVVSTRDREAILRDHSNDLVAKKLKIAPVGVELERFQYNPDRPDNEPRIVFTGNMGYFPNEDAVCWYLENVHLRVHRETTATFTIVGPKPSDKLVRLAHQLPDVQVTGLVPPEKMSELFQKATIAIAPMRSGSGMQFKVIEAYASGVPMVRTKYAKDGTDLFNVSEPMSLVAPLEPDDFAQTVIGLLKNKNKRRSIAKSAREYVTEHLSWQAIVSQIYRQITELSRS